MKTKQTSRIYLRGKDHKDVFFNGQYHSIMAAKNENGCDGVIWRKLYPSKYYLARCRQWWYNGYQTVSSLGIYYNELDIYREEYRMFDDMLPVRGAKWVAFTENAYKSAYGYTVANKFICLSKDGKYYKKFDLDYVICSGPFFVPDGFVYVYDDGPDYVNGTSYIYHVRVDDEMNRVGEEELICSFATGEEGFYRQNMLRCPHIGSDPEVILFHHNRENVIYALSLDGSYTQTDFTSYTMNYNFLSYQNGKFLMPLYIYSNYESYIVESENGNKWVKHSFPVNGVRGNIAVLWSGTEYICYADRYYDSYNYCLEVYAGRSLGSLSLVNSLKGDGYEISYISGDKKSKQEATLVFDSKYQESYHASHSGKYRVNAVILNNFITEAACFENYKQRIPEEILVGSTTLNKYQTYSTYWMLYIDNLYLKPSDKNFMCWNYVIGGEEKKWGMDIAEYYAKGGKP